uniref:Uncharacterized protein n=1 Tax=Brassica campestris TaxID=3711 RepID=A0A3P5ZSM8_BRACM|nr:unnamed protein product [Brassica rapa]
MCSCSQTSSKIIDELDNLRVKKNTLSEEAGLQSSSLKRLSDEAAKSPQNEEIKVEINALHDGIKSKNDQIATLEMTSHEALDKCDNVQVSSHLPSLCSDFFFMFFISQAILYSPRDSFAVDWIIYWPKAKTISTMKPNGRLYVFLVKYFLDCEVLQGGVANLKQHLSNSLELAQETKIQELKLKAKELSQSKQQLEHRNRKLAEESSYAKSLASAAAVELKALSEEVAKLMNHNRKLSAELSTHNSPIPQPNNKTGTTEEERAF